MTDLGKPAAPVRWQGFRPEVLDPSAIKVLVVDDNEALRYAVLRALREAGYQTIEATNGADALRLSAESPDLILLDINLPDMSGFQVCRQLKTSPHTSHIPVLHISSTFVDPEYRVKGLEGGADAYLAEPIDRAELIATINALLRLKQAETAARQQAERAEAASSELARLNAVLEDRIAERTAELTAANHSLRELSASLLQSQDQERRRIARDLHDSVGQTLAAIKMNNAIILRESSQLSERASSAANESNTLLDEILTNIRTISHLLHPPLLDEAGLGVALDWYVQEFSSRSGIQVAFDKPEDLQRLPPDVEIHIFRIVQECLGNVHRHSRSSTARVMMETTPERVSVQVSDDGVGISPARLRELRTGIRSGVGFRGMQERLMPFGGELAIASEGRGTTVTISVPNHHKASEQASA